ncbi:hypothetical protein [Streptomyces sp. NBC_01216]|uniref:hypothetical protein n=1 Tax=unclassified Streptomyces TaxID=2593676 RepID=UPI002E10E991
MRSARPGRLRLGDRVRFEEGTYTVVALTGMRVRLADVHGTGMLVDQVHLQGAEDFAVLGTAERATLGSAALLDHLPEEAAKRALWWQHHLIEILTGLPPDAPAGALPRPEYDPARRSLAERERAEGRGTGRAGRGGQCTDGQAQAAALRGRRGRRGGGPPSRSARVAAGQG